MEVAEGSPGKRQDNEGKSLLFPLSLSSYTCIPAQLTDQRECGEKMRGEEVYGHKKQPKGVGSVKHTEVFYSAVNAAG